MHVISTSDLMGPDWNFLADLNQDPALTFQSFSSLQPSGLASLVPHPIAGRLQGAARACRAARRRPDAILFSHLPMAAAVTNLARRMIAPSVPQIAFAFNFTTLNDDLRARFFARAFRGITEFVVYSTYAYWSNYVWAQAVDQWRRYEIGSTDMLLQPLPLHVASTADRYAEIIGPWVLPVTLADPGEEEETESEEGDGGLINDDAWQESFMIAPLMPPEEV